MCIRDRACNVRAQQIYLNGPTQGHNLLPQYCGKLQRMYQLLESLHRRQPPTVGPKHVLCGSSEPWPNSPVSCQTNFNKVDTCCESLRYQLTLAPIRYNALMSFFLVHKTFVKVSFWYILQFTQQSIVPLSPLMAPIRYPFTVLFIFRNKKKLHGVVFGEYDGCVITTVLFFC